MKKRLLMQGRRGAARRGVGFSLFAVISMSTLLGFAAQTVAPQTVRAEEPAGTMSDADSLRMRHYVYLRDCLLNHINDKSGQRDSWEDMFQRDGKKSPNKQVIAVGLDIDPKDGVASCEAIAKVAVEDYEPDTADYQRWLMREIWGTSIAANGGPVKVSEESVRSKARNLAARLQNNIDNIRKTGSDKAIALARLKPLLTQCYVGWSKNPPNNAENKSSDDIAMKERKIYAHHRNFDWDEVKIDGFAFNNISNKSNKGLGDVELGFDDQWNTIGRKWNDKETDWYPIGNDLGASVLNASNETYYKNHSGQTFLDCNWVKKHSEYLFQPTQSNRYFFVIENNKPVVRHKIRNEKGEIEEVSAETTKYGSGANSIVDEANGGDGTDQACGGGSGGGALRWILCPVVDAMNQAVDWVVKSVIEPALTMTPLENGGTLYEAWKGLRNIANVFLILIFLIIIFANFFTSNGSSYTIKKALPRLIAAAILIQFSYFICAIIIDIGNVLGNGIGTIIIEAPGSVAGGSGASIGANIASGLLTATTIAGGATIAIMSGGWVLLFPLAIGLIISILTMFLSLGMRLIAINLLIMLSPFALLAWILPNTDKYAKMWSSNFIKLVMMYPLIVMMFAAAQVVVKVGAGSDGSAWAGMLTLFAPIIAFMMVPATFKASGTIIGGVNSAIASRGKALTGATAGALGKNMKQTIGKQSALTFGDKNSTRLQRTAARFGMGAAGFGSGAQGKMRRAAAVGAAFKEKKDLLHHEFEEQGISGNNAEMLAEIFDSNTGEFKPGVDSSTQAAVMQMIGENGGVEEMSAMYEALRKNNNGRAKSSTWNEADRDLWNRGSASSRDKLAQSLPYAARPDGDRSVGKLDSEGVTRLKSAAGKATKDKSGKVKLEKDAYGYTRGDSHIETGLAEIAARARSKAGQIDPLDPKREKVLTQSDIDDAKAQQQKMLASVVGIGQSTDRRGRVDAENIKAIVRAADAGLLGDATMQIPGYTQPMNAKQIIKEFVDPATGQMRVIPESKGGGPEKTPPVI